MEIKKFEPKYRDDLIFMVLEAKNALNRVPTLNDDLLNINGFYFDKGDMFWIMTDENDRVIGSVGCNLLPNNEAVIHRLYVKANLKRQGFGTQLLETAENFAKEHGRKVMKLHLGEKKTYFESRFFYRKHGYIEYETDYMKKDL